MSPLAELVRSLPVWVQWLPGAFYTFLSLVVVVPLTWWLEHRLLRPVYALPSDAHWTERARLGFPVMSIMLSWVILATLSVGSAWLVWLGRLTPLYVGVPATLATFAVTVLSARRTVHFIAPERPRLTWRGLLFMLLSRGSSVLLFGSLWVVPLRFGWQTWFVLLALAIVFVLGVFGLWLRLAVLLRLARPARGVVAEKISEACHELGLPEVEGVIVPIPVVNAFAEVPGRMVLLTESLLPEGSGHLDLEECALVIRQELLSFLSPKGPLAFRLLGALVHLPLALLFPMRAQFGSGAVLALMALVVLSILILRTIEARVEGSRESPLRGAVYARVLEKIHAQNGVPAVLRGPSTLSLYERMMRAGVAPHYPKPALPPRRAGVLVVAFVLMLVALVGTRIAVMWGEVRLGSQLEAIHAVIGSTGGDADAFAQLGYARYRMADLHGAIVAYEASSSLRPSDPAAIALVARLHAVLGECDASRDAAFRASEISARRGDPAMEMMMRSVRREAEACRAR